MLDVVEEVYKKGGGLGEIPIVDDGTKFSNFDSLDYFGRQR